jgi:hypothetical protein
MNSATGYHELARRIIMASGVFVFESEVWRLLHQSFESRRREGWKKWRNRSWNFLAGRRAKGDPYLEQIMQMIAAARLGVSEWRPGVTDVAPTRTA